MNRNTASIIPNTVKYPHFQFNSGIFVKFIPYTPATNVSGMKIVATTVNVFITWFMRCPWMEKNRLMLLSDERRFYHNRPAKSNINLSVPENISNVFSE